jgi:hypothetical protein
MQKKRTGAAGTLVSAAMTLAAVLLILSGCPSGGDDGGGEDPIKPTDRPPTVGTTPEKPIINNIQTGFEFKDSVNLRTVTDADASNTSKMSAVISLTWQSEGAVTYNVYWHTEAAKPSTPKAANLTDMVCFARNLAANTVYFFWVEAKNTAGTAISEVRQIKTGNPGLQESGGVERADYPRNLQLVAENGSLRVSWNLVDRAGWYEVYYAKKGAVPHIDVYSTKTFKWNEAPYTNSTAYQNDTNPGYTRPIYPFQPDAPSGWTGYYIGASSYTHGDTRPVLGIDSFGQSGNPPAGAFYNIKEIWLDGELPKLVPYKKLDSAFSGGAVYPWKGTTAGTLGETHKFFGTSTTITGLQNGEEYEVWVRGPNTNGERGYAYITGVPGNTGALGSVTITAVETPEKTTRNLNVTWNKVTGADKYRLYVSKYNITPNPTMQYTLADDVNTYTIGGLTSNTEYYVWVVAEKNGVPGAFGSPVKGTTGAALSTGRMGDKVIAGTDKKVKTLVYVEVNEHNPLNAGSYILEDGTYLFDYVVLFAANIRSRTCTGSKDDGYCRESGPHVHFNDNVKHILDNRNKYIKPLQDKGIKVLLGLLGDHDGIGFASMTDAQIQTFVADVKKDVTTYNLDGVDFDDEWASKEDWNGWTNNYQTISPNSIWTYPTSTWGWPTSVKVYRNPNKGIESGNGQLTEPSAADMNRMWRQSGAVYYKTIKATRDALGSGKIVTLYEYNTGRYITENGSPNPVDSSLTKDKLQSVVDFALQPWYNQYLENSANGLSRNIYSPFGMDLGGQAYASQNGAPNPPIAISNNAQATNTIYDYASRYKQAASDGNAYGVLYFYALRPASDLLKRQSSDSRASVTKEEYLSMMSKIVFDQDVVITDEGGDYRKDW